MTITFNAIYENGVLKPTRPLPFRDKEEVRVSVESTRNSFEDARGMIGWKGTDEELDRLLAEIEFDEDETP